MRRELQGRFEKISTVGETVSAFIPAPLPPNPPLEISEFYPQFEKALVALGKLDSLPTLLPDPAIFLYTYIRKEAVLSSMIEGTQSSLSDLLLFELEEAPGVPINDVQEVSNYVTALNHGIKRMKEDFPFSLRLIKEMHAELLSHGRGSSKTPGEFRHSQNWIGGSRPGNAFFVPPPPQYILECLGALELFWHEQNQSIPNLLKAGLLHVQFETIHPFLDGNGRLGRLLITLFLYEKKLLQEPLLYLSLYFKTYRQEYYNLLNSVRIEGNWEAWLRFFCDAVAVTATQVVKTSRKILVLGEEDREKIRSLGRSSLSTLAIYKQLMINPIISAKCLASKTGLSLATTNRCLFHLCDLGIVSELTQKKRYRIFSYNRYLEILNQDLEM